MAYARKGGSDSDIYLVNTIRGFICYGCPSYGHYVDEIMPDLKTVREHLDEHLKAGHKIPKHTLERVDRELNEETNTNLSNIVFSTIIT